MNRNYSVYYFNGEGGKLSCDSHAIQTDFGLRPKNKSPPGEGDPGIENFEHRLRGYLLIVLITCRTRRTMIYFIVANYCYYHSLTCCCCIVTGLIKYRFQTIIKKIYIIYIFFTYYVDVCSTD